MRYSGWPTGMRSASTRSFGSATTRTPAASGRAPRRSSTSCSSTCPDDEFRKITYENADKLFKWKTPEPTDDLDALIVKR